MSAVPYHPSGRASRRLALLAAWLLAGCAAVAQSMLINAAPDLFAVTFNQYETRAEFKESVPLIRTKDWLGLTILARQKLERNPNRGEWWQIAGYGHMQLGELTVARDCFRRVTQLLPEEVTGWNLYAYTLKTLGDNRGALQAVERGIQSDPASGISYVILGELHREAGRVKPAVQAYERAIDIDSRDVFAWYGLGVLGKRYNDAPLYERAKKTLKELNPPMAEQLEKA